MLKLSEQEKQEIIRFIEAEKSLPDKYHFLLFEDKREALAEKWTDWIDCWSVDFDFESKRELIRIKNDPPKQTMIPGMEQPEQLKLPVYEEVWTGDYIFENEWQSFRTKKDRSLELISVAHECRLGPRKIAVKVVDIFGNDTMTIVGVTV